MMQRGEIWLVDFNPTIGAEISKIRPAVIVNSDAIGVLPLKLVAPITTWQDRFARVAWLVPIMPTSTNHLDKKSAVDMFQLRSISHQRFRALIGTMSNADLTLLEAAAKNVLQIS